MYSRSAFAPFGVVSVSLVLGATPVQSQTQNLYAANFNANTISVFNLTGSLVQTISGNLNQPQGLTFDSAGNLYVANNNTNTISEFDSSGVFQKFIGNSGNLNGPLFVAFTPAPEPGSMALLTGLFVPGGAFAVRRRLTRK
jgi:DNA-binding beta-propeller fold protein YncE